MNDGEITPAMLTAAATALREFDWGNYGLDDVEDADPEWTDYAAREVLTAAIPAFGAVARVLADLREVLADDSVTDPIGYLETLEIRLTKALGETPEGVQS